MESMEKERMKGRWVSNKAHGTHGSIKCQLLGPEFPQECPQNLDIKEMSTGILEVVGCRDNSVSEVLACKYEDLSPTTRACVLFC